VTRTDYLAAVINAYLTAPGTPNRASRSDWAIASNLFCQQIPMETVLHAIRLATLRRLDSGNPGPISSLAYFRQVATRLTKEELEPFYIAYVSSRFQQLVDTPVIDDTKTAASPPESRGL
jgi:hypothetical protein